VRHPVERSDTATFAPMPGDAHRAPDEQEEMACAQTVSRGRRSAMVRMSTTRPKSTVPGTATPRARGAARASPIATHLSGPSIARTRV
jgi:hypothetical protein